MDYNNNEWRPVGRGDPLKNDPTFDYSPPTLDRVKYWADSEKDKDKPEEVVAALVDAKLKKANPGKNEILLLGVTGDRMRGSATLQQYSPNVVKNAKGETPLLQPKYTSIRRSYYAHQLPTHLMPPPMQPMVPAAQQPQPTNMHQQLAQPQQLQAMHIIKPAHMEYRHNMPGHSFMTSSPGNSKSVHPNTPYFMSAATQHWMHTSSHPPTGTSISSSHSPAMIPGNSNRYSHPHSHLIDSHRQDSANYITYHTRPSLTSTPSIMLGVNGGMGHHDFYSPNSIRGSLSSSHKLSSSSSSRKPWIHDLLQKEFIKKTPSSYGVENIKSAYLEQHNIEPTARPQGISTNYAPVTFVTPTTPSTTSTTQTVYITSTTQKQTTLASLSPMYSSTTSTPLTTQAFRTTTTLSPTRLLIPNTSNLANRPTVAPLKMTTDSLFSHYNQPEKPLRGPMYLIIEGHSKVKTYGKDELDPHKPKIVPIIPKREPVIRIADPNEKRGTPETFQVKHLHTKPMDTTESLSNTTTPSPQTSVISATTKKPTESVKRAEAKMTATFKPKTTLKATTTTVKPTPQKLITSSTAYTTTTIGPWTSAPATKAASKPQLEKTFNKKLESTSKSDKIPKLSAKNSIPNALDTNEKPSHQELVYEPPTGMQGLFSFLDASLGKIFKDDPMQNKTEEHVAAKDTTTKLKPILIKPPNTQQIEARVSTKLEPIKAADYEDYENDNYFKMTTEYLPRETRQVFDYDQLPESRINLKDGANLESFLKEIDEDDNLSAFNLNDEYEQEEIAGQPGSQASADSSDDEQNLIKRIDSFISSSIEDDFDDHISSIIDDDDLTDIKTDKSANLARNQQPRQKEFKKA